MAKKAKMTKAKVTKVKKVAEKVASEGMAENDGDQTAWGTGSKAAGKKRAAEVEVEVRPVPTEIASSAMTSALCASTPLQVIRRAVQSAPLGTPCATRRELCTPPSRPGGRKAQREETQSQTLASRS